MVQTNHSNLFKKINSSLKWNALGGVIFQGLLALHTITLSKIMTLQLFGVLGTILSIIYLSISLLDFGLKDSLGIIFRSSMQNRNVCKKYILKPIFFQTTLIAIVLFSLYFISCFIHINSHLLTLLKSNCMPIGYILFIILGEWINQTFKTILQLNFSSKFVAKLETFYILSYITTIWATYFYTKTITLSLLLLPLAIIAWISVIILTLAISILYLKLPIMDNIEKKLPTQKNIFRHRFIIYLATISKSLFSANFIVPFFAYTLGAQQAGFIKISSHISFLMSTIAKHTFGISSTTLLAHLKHEPIQTKKPFLDYFNKKIIQLISSTSLIFLLNLAILPSQFNYILSRANYITIIVFLWLNLSEIILITYEKILIIEEKTMHFIAIQILNYSLIATTILLHHLFLSFALSITLISFGLIRLLYILLVSYTIYKLWNLPVNINIKNFKLLGSYTQ